MGLVISCNGILLGFFVYFCFPPSPPSINLLKGHLVNVVGLHTGAGVIVRLGLRASQLRYNESMNQTLIIKSS